MSNREFENFDAAMRKLISVPHDRIKAELEKEKAAKSKGKSLASAKKKSAKNRSK